jgi:hypothetical protein
MHSIITIKMHSMALCCGFRALIDNIPIDVCNCFLITNLYQIYCVVFVGFINSFLLLPNVVGTNVMISFMILSMSFFVIHKMMWA